MIVLDASVVIAYFDADDALHRRADGLLRRAEDDELSMSVVTQAEVLVQPARAGRLAEYRRALGLLEVAAIGLGPEAGVQLAEIRAQTGLRLPDCCVLQAVESSGAELATFDSRLSAAAERRGLAVRPG